jgi:hypothetical protein
MATSQPAEDRPASPKTALRPKTDDDVQPLRSVRRMPIDQVQPTNRAGMPASNDRRRAGATLSTYRQLVSRGLAPGEAANLTAYLNRLPIGDQPWTLTQVNMLLFLRSLRQSGRFGSGRNPSVVNRV